MNTTKDHSSEREVPGAVLVFADTGGHNINSLECDVKLTHWKLTAVCLYPNLSKAQKAINNKTSKLRKKFLSTYKLVATTTMDGSNLDTE